jgi:4-amino-4-deoxy-L-arabinose transferase-like glycosyltransferase
VVNASVLQRNSLFAIVILLGSFLFIYRCHTNPAGFFVDESSVAFNAYTISQTGQDEFGNSWPLYFRAFGDYKNPVYVYVLALIFKVTGPGIFTARLFSAIAGILAVLLLGYLASRITKDWRVVLLVLLMAFLTPWLFEMSRVVFEVALYPLVVVLFLIAVRRAATREIWSWTDVLSLACTLALLTYTYSIGRLLAPLFAAGLAIFITRKRVVGLIGAWITYALTLIPVFTFQRDHNGALTARFDMISYWKSANPIWINVLEFIKHYFANLNPIRFFYNGDPNIYQVAHVYGQPVMLSVTFALSLIGICLVLLRQRGNRWWIFLLYVCAVSVIPASLTVDYFHMLRLIVLPVLLLLFTIPALEFVFMRKERVNRVALIAAVVLIVVQGVAFQITYHRAVNNAWRRHLFDADYKTKIFDIALRDGRKPIYLADALDTPYIQAYWYGTLRGLSLKDFVRLKPDEVPPVGSLVITTYESCTQENVISQTDPYTLYTAPAFKQLFPLPANAFRAEISVVNEPTTVHVGERIELGVLVKNVSEATWPGCQRGPAKYQIYLGSRWQTSVDQPWSREEARSPLPHDLAPGESAPIKLLLTAPPAPGDYSFDLDLVQEQVSWFADRGSTRQTVNIRVR